MNFISNVIRILSNARGEEISSEKIPSLEGLKKQAFENILYNVLRFSCNEQFFFIFDRKFHKIFFLQNSLAIRDELRKIFYKNEKNMEIFRKLRELELVELDIEGKFNKVRKIENNVVDELELLKKIYCNVFETLKLCSYSEYSKINKEYEKGEISYRKLSEAVMKIDFLFWRNFQIVYEKIFEKLSVAYISFENDIAYLNDSKNREKFSDIEIKNSNLILFPKVKILGEKFLLNIKHLDISNNSICELFDMEYLKRLIYLNLENNRLIRLHSICCLYNLKRLFLRNNELIEIPDSVRKLKNLEELDISRNKLKKITNFIGSLKNLKKAWFNDNYLEVIPESIGNLTKLEYITFYNNLKLKALPNSFEKIIGLEIIFDMYENFPQPSWFFSCEKRQYRRAKGYLKYRWICIIRENPFTLKGLKETASKILRYFG
jgi:hypothetical protein